MQQKIIRQYQILSCLISAGGLSLVSAIYVTYLMKNGLNFFQVNLVNTVFFITIFICEIPTGAIADVFGRKASLVLACAMLSLSMFVYGTSHSFIGFITAEVLAAIGFTFQSGAFQAWLIDSLKHTGYKGEFSAIFARQNLFCQITAGCAAIIGAYLFSCNPSFPWILGSSILAGTTLTSILIMKEDYFKKRVFSLRSGFTAMQKVVRSSIQYGMCDKAVRFILVVTALQTFAIQPLNMYWQPFFKSNDVQEKHLGFIFAAIMACLAIGAFIASRVNGTGIEKRLIVRTQAVTGIIVLLTVTASGLPSILTIFLLHEVARGFYQPFKENYLHKDIPSNERATIASFCSMISHIGGAVGLVVSGWITQKCGISTAWTMSGIVLVVGAFCVARNGHKKSN